MENNTPIQEKFPHEIEMEELHAAGIDYNKLPREVQGQIMAFNKIRNKYVSLPEGDQRNEKKSDLEKKSFLICDKIQTFKEAGYPEEEETPNTNNMSPELLERAKAVGLDETASEEQIVAAEEKKKSMEALSERAKAVGLPETAAEEEVAAAEALAAAGTPPPDPAVPPTGDPNEDAATKAAREAKEKADGAKAKLEADEAAKKNKKPSIDIMDWL
jgi:hypothetical protein